MYHPGSKGKSQCGKAQPLIHEKWKKWAGKKESKHPNTFKQISQHIYPISRHIYQISQHIYHPLLIRGILFPACLKVGRGKDWEIQVKWLRFPIKSNWFGLERTLKITRILVFRSISSAEGGSSHSYPARGRKMLGEAGEGSQVQACPTGRIQPLSLPSQTISLPRFQLFSHFSRREWWRQSLWFNSWG